MSDLLVALALVLVIEGVLYALFPDLMRRVLAMALSTPVAQLRLGGLIAAIIGVCLAYLVHSP